MSIHSPVTVTVPATTANLGPGFDCIGAALTLYNTFTFTRLSSDTPWETERAVRIRVSGVEANQVKTDETNLAYQAFLKLYNQIGHTPPPVQLKIDLDVPLARGLGSSATAIVGGLVGANQLAGEPLSQTEVMQLAIALEGHPDNVVPAILGGCRLAARGDAVLKEWEICDIPWHDQIIPVVAIPNFELSTQQARQVLPSQVSRADAIFNVAHFGLLIRALATGRGDWLQTALQDTLHQPYRQALIPGYEAVQTAALKAGAYGVTISGAGPTLLALVDPMQAEAVVTAMAEAWQEVGISAIARSHSIDTQGTQSAIAPAI
ncbi:MAG: homoserine kinase [Coleofasciculus sp. D1-CHI-01]|uniref:homoserine kinase n=1 Tax=Coleofasciculus sp. D1-CHI-01 TaxID=3068482 RepID=UPI0033018714